MARLARSARPPATGGRVRWAGTATSLWCPASGARAAAVVPGRAAATVTAVPAKTMKKVRGMPLKILADDNENLWSERTGRSAPAHDACRPRRSGGGSGVRMRRGVRAPASPVASHHAHRALESSPSSRSGTLPARAADGRPRPGSAPAGPARAIGLTLFLLGRLSAAPEEVMAPALRPSNDLPGFPIMCSSHLAHALNTLSGNRAITR